MQFRSPERTRLMAEKPNRSAKGATSLLAIPAGPKARPLLCQVRGCLRSSPTAGWLIKFLSRPRVRTRAGVESGLASVLRSAWPGGITAAWPDQTRPDSGPSRPGIQTSLTCETESGPSAVPDLAYWFFPLFLIQIY